MFCHRPWVAGLLVVSATATLFAEAPRPWTEYRTILWLGAQAQKHRGEPALLERLRELGINTASTSAGSDPAWLSESGLGHYVENMVSRGLCLKFRSNVTNWSRFVDQWKEKRSEAGLVRDYSFEDPVWLNNSLGDFRRLVSHHAPAHPIAYDLRDELSVTISANPFDYDFAPVSLAAFRDWLKGQYASLDALNRQWETSFARWDDVKPFTTDQIKHRMATGEAAPAGAGATDWQAVRRATFEPERVREEPTRWNFSPWADHRTYMDLALASTLRTFASAAHELDPDTPVGIEGTQMPHAFGGYDLWRLSQVLDWVEPYDVCNSREILGSFMPGKPMLATVFEKETLPAQRRLWHLLLEGDRGCIVWWSEDVMDWSKPDLPLTAKGRALAPALRQMTSPLARLFMLAEREQDPIAIHYSQPSIQVAWLLESVADGPTWLRRFSSYEADHNRHAVLRNAWLKAFQDAGFSPVFLAAEEIEKGALEARGVKVLALPGSRAMSDQEVDAVTQLVARPHHVLCGQGVAALFDQHGTARKTVPPLLNEFGEPGRPGVAALMGMKERVKSGEDISKYVTDRLRDDGPKNVQYLVRQMAAHAGLVPPVQIPFQARVRVHRYRIGSKERLVAFERNIEYKMREELAQAGGNEALEQPATFTATLSRPGWIVNLRTGEKLGFSDQIEVKLDPWSPSLFAILSEEPQGDVVETLLRSAN